MRLFARECQGGHSPITNMIFLTRKGGKIILLIKKTEFESYTNRDYYTGIFYGCPQGWLLCNQNFE